MPTLKLHIQDREQPLLFPIHAGTTLLIGREPNLARLKPGWQEELRKAPVQMVKVPSLTVSGNHVLVSNHEGSIKVLDLRSRNGTWMRLISEHPITLPGDSDVVLELAGPSIEKITAAGPRDAEWATEEEYGSAIVRSLSDWFQQIGVPARVFSAPARPGGPTDDTIALADGASLHVLPPQTETFDIPWRAVVDRVREYVNAENVRYEQLQGHDEDFILVAPLMREAHRHIVDAAAYGMRLMLLGPTGAGKERLARCYHKHSRQHRGPYATVNCALLKENLLFAQLFGAKKGSYTGAVQDVVGVVEAAHEGTLFLDEVGEMDLEVQKALLRFLDSRGEYQRLGDTHTRRANVQIVCATNLSLDNGSERRGKFRDDLWYRLAVKVVNVPPLSQRREDIIAFLKSRYLRGGQIRAIDALSPEAIRLVLADPWPGNFRDLLNFIDRLPPTAVPGTVDESLCRAALQEGRGRFTPAGPTSPSSGTFRPLPAQADDNWSDIANLASAAFEEDNGAAPKNWGQIQTYTEKYLKPVFVAHTAGLREINELTKNINYSELARRLNIADGTTVKMHLLRYIERFRRSPLTPES